MDSLEQQLAAIDARVKRIEDVLHMPKAKAAKVAAAPAAAAKSPSRPATTPYIAPPETEIAHSGSWLGIIAVLCFVLAAGFMIKLSIESGWLTPARQIGIAVMFGFGLIASGFMLLKSDRQYASLLPGAGVIVLYLSVFAAHNLHGLINMGQALGFTSAISLVCIWLYTQIKHDVYPITAALGVYVAPAILGMHASSTFTLYYYVFCSLAFAILSIWVKTRTLTLVSSYLAVFMTGLIGDALGDNMLVAQVLALHFVIFAVGTYLYSHQTGTMLTRGEAMAFLPVLLIFYVMEYEFIERINPAAAPWLSLGFSALLIALYVIARQRFDDRLQGSQFLVVAFATLAFFHSGYMELWPENMGGWLFVAIMLAIGFAPLNKVDAVDDGIYQLPKMALMVILGVEYLNLLGLSLFSSKELPPLLLIVAFASMWAVIVAGKNTEITGGRQGTLLLGAAHMLAISALYQWADPLGSLAVSAAWLFYAVGVMLFAFMRKDEVMMKSALLVLSFAAGKALLYDAASAPTIVRIGCLMLTGAVLYGAGLVMRKIAFWKE